MELTVKDLELFVNDQNKALYNSLFDLVLIQFENALKDTDVSYMTEIKKETMATCGIYLSSLVELLHTTRDLLDKGYIESGASVATACWERALTLRKIMIEPELNAQIHTDHRKAKSTPWSVWNMVRDVNSNERKQKNIEKKRPYEDENFYIQYTFLSSIKHGNPYTISYLNRPGYSSDDKLFRFKGNDSFQDKDLKTYIKLLAVDNALDALIDYSGVFRTRVDSLLDLRRNFDGLMNTVELQVPTVMSTSPEEMGQTYWDYLVEMENKRRF